MKLIRGFLFYQEYYTLIDQRAWCNGIAPCIGQVSGSSLPSPRSQLYQQQIAKKEKIMRNNAHQQKMRWMKHFYQEEDYMNEGL